jgi:hypothetical protein
MSEALALAQPLVHLVARNPVEMQEARSSLAEWLKAKIAVVNSEMEDYQDSLAEAVAHKWGAKGLKKAISSAFWRKEFYEKTLAAVEAGFTIVPEFPIDVFAIRVERMTPEGSVQSARYGRAIAEDERCEILPTGSGQYVSPRPKTVTWREGRKDNEGTEYKVNLVQPTKLQPVEFPIRSARAEVMSATAEAMALKVFDQIGICPQTRKADPLIIGRILLPDSDRMVNFLIAWHLNLTEL